MGPWGPAGPNWDWCALLLPGGEGCSLPRGCGNTDPDSIFLSLLSCMPRGGSFGETAMETS
jgi:hypothetical protein